MHGTTGDDATEPAGADRETYLRLAASRTKGRILRFLADTLPPKVVFQHGSRASRKIALTFDDGPGPLTPAFLDVLGDLGVRASFFVIGRQCARAGELLTDLVGRGHDLAGHGWSHTPFIHLSYDELSLELDWTRTLLEGRSVSSWMVRPPFGRMTPASLLHTARAGYTSAMWSFDPLDWQQTEASGVLRAVDPARLRGGDIILLHERRATLDALPELVRRLRAADFELAPATELLAGVLRA